MTDTQAELHEYLKANNLNAIFVSIVEAILIEKPENPIGFMTKYLLVSETNWTNATSGLELTECLRIALGQVSRRDKRIPAT